MPSFRAPLEIVGINPFVRVPDRVLQVLHRAAGRDRGPIPIRGRINGRPYVQRLVRFRGMWRLYVNMQMLDDSPRRIGEVVAVSVAFDPSPRTISPPPLFAHALKNDPLAQRAFSALTPSRQLEIVRYLANLKSIIALERNIEKAMSHLRGEDRFGGREPKR